MRVSVAMCTYNDARFVSGQLASISAQTRLPDELVICDDCSTDKTLQIVRTFAIEAPFPVRVRVNHANLGPHGNFENAISSCTGDAVVLCCGDDIWLRNKLELIEEAFAASHSVGLVLSDAELIDERSRPTGKRLWRSRGLSRVDRYLIPRGRRYRLLRGNICATYGTTMAFRLKYADAIIPLSRSWEYEDAWIAVIVASVAEVALIPKPLVRYRQHASNFSGSASDPIRRRMALAAGNRAEVFMRRSHRLQVALDHVAGLPGADLGFLRHLAQARDHMCSRAQLGDIRRISRAPLVASELLSGAYGRYSGGWRSAAADFLLRSG